MSKPGRDRVSSEAVAALLAAHGLTTFTQRRDALVTALGYTPSSAKTLLSRGLPRNDYRLLACLLAHRDLLHAVAWERSAFCKETLATLFPVPKEK
jgi:hypothetical protein